MPRKWILCAVLLPLVVIGLGIVRAEYHLAHSKKWLFDVAGYDPRDLLRGRYIQFRLELHEDAAASDCTDALDDRCCLCLSATSPAEPPRVRRTSCVNARTQCDGFMQARYLPELRRYYIPEEEAWKLEQQFQDAVRKDQARLLVAIDDEGKPQIESLLVHGETIRRAPR